MFKKLIDKYKSMSVITKAALWFSFALFLQKGISFLTVPIFTRIMSVEQYGYFSVYLSWVSVFTIIGGLEFHTCAYINGLVKDSKQSEKNELAISLLSLSFVITTIILLIFLISPSFWSNIFELPSSIILLMILEVYFIPVYNLWATKQRCNYNYKLLVCVTLLQSILNVLLGLVLVYFAEESNQALMRVLGISGIQIVLGLVLILSFVISAKKVFSVKYWKYALKLHIPLLPHSLSLTILSSADRIMIQKIISETEAAIYSVAYSACMVVNMLKIAITQALTPWIYECLKNKEFKSLKKNINLLMLFFSSLIFLFILFGPELIKIVGTDEYYSAIYVLPPVAASVVFTFLYSIFSTVEFYFEKTNGIMFASIFAAVLNIILNLIFIPIFGFVAAGYTTLVCYIVLCLAHYIMMKKVVRKNNFNEKDFFDMKFLFIVSCLVLTACLLLVFTYNYFWLRYCLIGLIIIILLINVKRIKIFIEKLKKSKN